MSIVAPFLIGSMIGAALGAQFIVALPKYMLQIVIAVFILASTWAPKFQSASTGRVKFFVVGVITTIVTMFVGGTGVLVGAFVAPACPERHQFVSTHSVVMTIQHGLKIVNFAVLGFRFWLLHPAAHRAGPVQLHRQLCRKAGAQSPAGADFSHRAQDGSDYPQLVTGSIPHWANSWLREIYE